MTEESAGPASTQSPHTEEVRRIFETMAEKEMERIAQEGFERAVDKWLNKRFAQFGRWTLASAGAIVFVWILKVLVAMHGVPFQAPPTH